MLGIRPVAGFRRAIRFGALIAFCAVLSGWTLKGTEVGKTYYSISGQTHAELVASVRRNGPRAGSAYGMGVIDFFPDYDLDSKDGQCRVIKADVGLRIALRLPKWSGPDDAPKSISRFAGRFSRVIEAHEMQHVVIARRFAVRMAVDLRKLKPRANCWDLRQAAQIRIKELKKQHLTAQCLFDERTRKQIRGLLPLPRPSSPHGVGARRCR